MSQKSLHTESFDPQDLVAGEMVSLSGTVYTARDAAHRRLVTLLDAGQPIPFSLRGSLLYYAGPTPAPPGRVIGSCGPTTAGRMDAFTPRMLAEGVRALIGKGERSASVCEALRENGAVYLCAVGGAGALLSGCVTSATVVAFPELGCEAVRLLTVQNMPLIVAADAYGGNVFRRETRRVCYD